MKRKGQLIGLLFLLLYLFSTSNTSAQTETVLEKRKAGTFVVLVTQYPIAFGETHKIKVFDGSNVLLDELTFIINQSSDQGCSETISGKYVFTDPFTFEITRSINKTFCGFTYEDPTSANDISKDDFLKIDDPYEIIDRNTVSKETKLYGISGQGKIQEQNSKTEITTDKIYHLQKLDWLPKSNLRIMRNSVFARYGYKFKSKDLQDYFAKKPWYKPTLDNVDKLLTRADKEVVAYLTKLENKK